MLEEDALALLRANLVKGNGYLYTCPDRTKYQHQWLWDSCFHAIVWSNFDVEVAKQELTTLTSKQFGNGMLSHMLYWRDAKGLFPKLMDMTGRRLWPVKDRSMITQPPVIARAVEAVYERSGDKKFVEFILEPVIKFYEWLHGERTDRDNLVFIINPWESGMDDTPKWDAVFGIKSMQKAKMLMSYMKLIKECNRVSWNMEEIKKLDIFVVKDVSFNAIYVLGLNSLARLCDLTGRQEDAKVFRERAEKTTESLIKKCWHSRSSFFCDLYSSGDKTIEELTVTGLFPIALEGIGKDKTDALVSEHLLNKEEFWARYPIPSVSLSSKKFSPRGGAPSLWRGTTWVNCNWYVVNGLLKHGYTDTAKEISKRTLEMVEKSGFREHYNPLTGEGYGAKNFGWSTLAVEMENFSRKKPQINTDEP